MENPYGSNESGPQKSETLEALKDVGIELSGRFDAMSNTTFDKAQEVKPNTWNENAGVIVFADNRGKLFAVPSTDRYRTQLLADSKLVNDSSIGVPHLGVPEVWGQNPNEADNVLGFQEWREAVHQAEVIRSIEKNERENPDSAEGGLENKGEPTLEELGNQYKV